MTTIPPWDWTIWDRRMVQMQGRRGRLRSRPGFVIGDIAITNVALKGPVLFKIVHLATGLRILGGYSDIVRARSAAELIVRTFNGTAHWAGMDPEGLAVVKARLTAVVTEAGLMPEVDVPQLPYSYEATKRTANGFKLETLQ
ncbi:hypothetical protein sos41_11620 [Alphaproteobacteria bacterium SO-S41]|nr:hypothetical protein sos41_11620 [Alphaproteobacteria bacterium SO-S41]